MDFTRLTRCPGVQASRPSITRPPRATDRLFHLHSFTDSDGCTITQSSASSRPLELLVARWSEDRLGAVGHSNTSTYHVSPVGVLGCSNLSLSKYRPDMTLQMAGHVVQHAAGN